MLGTVLGTGVIIVTSVRQAWLFSHRAHTSLSRDRELNEYASSGSLRNKHQEIY